MVGDNVKNELLPIGTVVLLEGGTRKVMICGYSSKSTADKTNKVYDYNGCVFPEGFMENIFCLFDNKQIKEVCYLGLENEEFENYKKIIERSKRPGAKKIDLPTKKAE